jgi:hypothetical protein
MTMADAGTVGRTKLAKILTEVFAPPRRARHSGSGSLEATFGGFGPTLHGRAGYRGSIGVMVPSLSSSAAAASRHRSSR